jgi:hypothetical protein
MTKLILNSLLLAALTFTCSSIHSPTFASPVATRDPLTPKEVDLVKEAQLIDQRVAVFVHAVERRFLVLSDPNAASSKQVQKEAETWGELPKGTRAELLGDIANILDEAITNIDDVAAREDANQKLMQKSLRKLSDAATRFLAQLQPMRSQSPQGPEREAIEQAIDNANAIIEAASKLPPETKTKGKS